MGEATNNTQNNATKNASLEHLSDNISDEEALLFSFSLTGNNAEEIEREMDLAIADVSCFVNEYWYMAVYEHAHIFILYRVYQKK